MNIRYMFLDLLTQAAIEIETFDPQSATMYGFTSSRFSFGKVSELAHDGTLILSTSHSNYSMGMNVYGIRLGHQCINYDVTEEELFQLSTIDDIGELSFSDIQYSHYKYCQLVKRAKTKAALSRDLYNMKQYGSNKSVLDRSLQQMYINSMNSQSLENLQRQLNGITTPSITQITKNGRI